jgi:hypothetical protein
VAITRVLGLDFSVHAPLPAYAVLLLGLVEFFLQNIDAQLLLAKLGGELPCQPSASSNMIPS